MVAPAGLLSRSVAKAIDLVIFAAFTEVLHETGIAAGVIFILIADGIFDGRSPGKMLLRLRTVREDGSPATIREAILRNLDIALALILWQIPLLGWFFLGGILFIDFVVLLGSNKSQRMGDLIAGTTVVEPEKEV